MGERAGYRLIAPDWYRGKQEPEGPKNIFEPPDGLPKTSPIYRMQWFLGDEPRELQAITLALVNRLTNNARDRVGGGMGALRSDLKYDRLWPNFLITLGTLNNSPYNSIHEDTNCDITDHGLFTLRVVHWSDWMWEWNRVLWGMKTTLEDGTVLSPEGNTLVGQPIPLVRTVFTEGKHITEGGLRFEVSSSGFKEAFGIEYEGGEISAEP